MSSADARKDIYTQILKTIPDAVNVVLYKGKEGCSKVFQVLDSEGKARYLLRQTGAVMDKKNFTIAERIKVQMEANNELCNNSPYIGKKIGYKSKEIKFPQLEIKIMVAETLEEYRGSDIIALNLSGGLKSSDILNIVFQSALALVMAHTNGIFHGEVTPFGMTYQGGVLKLSEFHENPLQCHESIVNEYFKEIRGSVFENNRAYYPPEVLHYDEIIDNVPILPEKIDTYCWGMSMLHFLIKKNYEDFSKIVEPMTRSTEDRKEAKNSVFNLEIPGLDKKTSESLMKILRMCLKFSACERSSMVDILWSLIIDNDDFPAIVSALPPELRKQHTIEAVKLINDHYLCVNPILTDEDDKSGSCGERLLKKGKDLIDIFLGSPDMLNKPIYKKIIEHTGSVLELQDIKADFLAVAAALTKNTTIHSLNLQGNNLEDGEIEFIAAALLMNKSLTTLSLVDNKIGEKGFDLLASAIANNQTLLEIYLDKNNGTDKGVEHLTTSLKENKILQKISLKDNSIGEAGKELLKNFADQKMGLEVSFQQQEIFCFHKAKPGQYTYSGNGN